MKVVKKDTRARVLPVVPSRGRVSVPARLKRLDRTQRHAVLATISAGGPYECLMAFAMTKDGKSLVFATPVTTTKHRNMMRDSRVSLLIDSRRNNGGDYLSAEAVTVVGRAREIRKGRRWSELAALLVSKHPQLQSFVSAPTTALMLVAITRCVHVGKFQCMSVWIPPRHRSSNHISVRMRS
jgi:nitroimidazol reductase NimA-like FMN-containing flavoprotein (pyridoxamine 5'-phosphate oxidase superfamily)